MTRLSVNIDKIALLRNSREHNNPNLKEFVKIILGCGVNNITMHPREDKRHALLSDVDEISKIANLNVETDIRDVVIFNAIKNKVEQVTFVPTMQGEKTTTRGFSYNEQRQNLAQYIPILKQNSIFVSIFIDPEKSSIEYAQELNVDGVELNTMEYTQNPNSIKKLKIAANLANQGNLKVHLGHDLTLANLPALLKEINADEVSIGHALIVDALKYGLSETINKYKKICESK